MNVTYDEERRRQEAVFEAVANQLEVAMHANSLSGPQLAMRSGMGENTIYRILHANNVHLSSVIRLATAMRLRVRIELEPL